MKIILIDNKFNFILLSNEIFISKHNLNFIFRNSEMNSDVICIDYRKNQIYLHINWAVEKIYILYGIHKVIIML
jgi:hypothetical protein